MNAYKSVTNIIINVNKSFSICALLTFGAAKLLGWSAVLCITGCLAPSVTSATRCPQHFAGYDNQNVSKYCQMSWGEGVITPS